jgi:signal transduction histidine kinase
LGQPEEGIELLKDARNLLEGQENDEIILSVQTNLAFGYSELGEHTATLNQLLIAEENAKNLDDDYTLVFIDNLYGASYYNLKQYAKAIKYYSKSLRVAKELGLLNEQDKALFGLYEAEEKLGNFRQSLVRFEEYNLLKDSLFNVESKTRLDELQEKYDTEQKEHEISNLNSKNHSIVLENNLKTKQLQFSRLIAGIIAFAILILSLFFFQRIKRHKSRLVHNKGKNEEHIRRLISDQEISTLEAVVEAQQKERKTLAKDLHDTLGSYLATLKYQHEAVGPASNDKAANSNYQKTSGLIEKASAELRSISHQMITGEGVQFDLISATNELIERIKLAGKFSISFNSFISDDLPDLLELTLYKIIQEMLSNVLNHSKANEVTLQINEHDDEITVLLEDDGIGFDKENIKSNGIGLSNIADRVQSIDGKLEINSGTNKGTTILVVAPIN